MDVKYFFNFFLNFLFLYMEIKLRECKAVHGKYKKQIFCWSKSLATIILAEFSKAIKKS